MSNFDFGGGPGPGQTPPPPIQLPAQQAQFAQDGLAAPPQQQSPAAQDQEPAKGPGGGITPVGLISLLAIIALVLGVAWTGNRFWPINSRIDSAWRSADGNAKELTSFLRDEGFTCSDEGAATDLHFHRLCARFTETDKLAIEFAGPTSGEIMRVHVQPHGQLTQEGTAAATRAVDLSVPDQNGQRTARAALTAGQNSAQDVTGPWGRAGWADGTFTVARTWSGPTVGTYIPGNLGAVRDKAAQAGYRCDAGTEVLQCQRTANGAAWSFTARQSADPAHLSDITFTGRINDPERLDPAEELDTVLPASRELNRMKWFVASANQRTGQAGFARGVRMNYAVTPTDVSIEAGTGCRVDGGGAVSC
ncbi:hypothetical protein [Granulicoccus sp. GXG6511]|uniref:hypothetical protein n=1 Tax=Granulicoccus sp. GXG6511 TaxID=3381351 RepID=UPI003D7EC1DD